MIWIILCVIAAIVLAVICGLYEVPSENHYRNPQIKWKLCGKHVLVLLAAVLLIPGFFTKIPANSVGIVYSPFSGTRETTLDEGFSTKNILDKVYKISTEVQTKSIENMTTQTMDSQYVTTVLDIKYRVNSANAYLVFKQFRTLDKMSEQLIVPTTQRVMEKVTTQYNVIEILGEKRGELYTALEQELTAEFAKYGVEFYSISITDMDAGDEIEAAITQQAVAKQAVETAEQELLKAQTEAKQKSVQAQAEQDAAKIKAETQIIEAEAAKKANELLQQSLTDELLMQQWIEKWNGKVPEYYGGEGTDLIFNTGELAGE